MPISLKVDIDTYNKIKEYYEPYNISFNGEYIDFVSVVDATKITGYTSSKTYRKVVFEGDNDLLEASKWGEVEEKQEEVSEAKPGYIDIEEQIGSDEVGVGDYFLPMIVVAAYVRPQDMKRLKELGVSDSKKLTDKKIMEIGPYLVKEFIFSKLTLPNEKYNEQVSLGENSHSLKAKMHNRALANLLKKYPDIYRIYVDQFVNGDKFYSYLNEKDEPIVKGIAFKTKGESFFPSVALASVIARYSLLLEKEKLDNKYQVNFPFGASKKVDEFAHQLSAKISKEEFDKLVKQNFKNFSR